MRFRNRHPFIGSIWRLAVLAILGIGLVAGCAKPIPVAAEPATVRMTLPQSTPIKLILLQKLQSGDANEGEPVALAVGEDVVQDGSIVIPKGSVASASVTWSRKEGTLGGLLNQPARLEIGDLKVKLEDGREVPLSSDQNKSQPYALNRENTDRKNTERVESLSKDPDAMAAAEKVTQALETGDIKSIDTQSLQLLSERMQMDNLNRIVTKGESDKVTSLLKTLRQGGAVSTAASGGSLGIVAAAFELVDVVGDVGSRLKRMLSGRNITAHVGTVIPVYTSKETLIEVRSRK